MSGVDHDGLSRVMRVLGTPARLRILREVAGPRRSSEIVVPAGRQDGHGRPMRPLARQTVEEHLAKLESIGLVRSEAARDATRYVLDHGKLFTVADELARLTMLPPPQGGPTITDDMATLPAPATGPGLFVVNSPIAGTFFALEGRGPFVLGRDPDLWASVAYDPFIARRHFELAAARRGFALTPRESASNPTYRNGVPVPASGAQLVDGDVLQAGRTLMVVQNTA